MLGPADGLAGLHWATGHHRNGILLAPATADLVADGLAGGGASVPAAFAPRRFDKVPA